MSDGSGRFVWHDLMTTDKNKAVTYYTKLFGWKVRPVNMGPGVGVYEMIHVEDQPIGGFVPLDGGLGIPSHWIGYVSVDDVDAAVAAAVEAGGAELVSGTDIPDVGRFAVVGDPGGGWVSPFQGLQAQEVPPPVTGHFCWDELLTQDVDGCKAFYSQVFGWSSEREIDLGELGRYTVFKSGDAEIAGMLQISKGNDQPLAWLPYVKVTDVDESSARSEELGGKVWVAPTEVPGIGRFSVTGDPTGALIGLYRGAS